MSYHTALRSLPCYSGLSSARFSPLELPDYAPSRNASWWSLFCDAGCVGSSNEKSPTSSEWYITASPLHCMTTLMHKTQSFSERQPFIFRRSQVLGDFTSRGPALHHQHAHTPTAKVLIAASSLTINGAFACLLNVCVGGKGVSSSPLSNY